MDDVSFSGTEGNKLHCLQGFKLKIILIFGEIKLVEKTHSS